MRTRERMRPVFTPNQVLGRSRAIGCTAVEITQRCNLDCTLCYLSESSAQVRDPPFDEIIRRLDAIRATYGPGTNVQITGGDPTLRKHRELVAFVRHARSIGLYPALFTNGIAASRKLLAELTAAGLTEVAFHVDTTQRRAGFQTELDLNAVRREYIGRARNLGLMVVFNTTVHGGNLEEIPDLVRFFVAQSADVGFASFQLQADTGRGEWGRRASGVSLEAVRERVNEGAACALPWDVVRIGHPRCHSYVPTLVINRRVHPIVCDQRVFSRFLADFAHLGQDRRSPKLELALDFGKAAVAKPVWLLRGLAFAARMLWRAKADLLAGGGRIRKMSFFIHNFMDADDLDPERARACSFMLMSADGPVSMCEHNARRDEFILKPIRVMRRDGREETYVPLPELRRHDESPRRSGV
jgi:molybdenum cofactor biosynthesis enzyme MoaA